MLKVITALAGALCLLSVTSPSAAALNVPAQHPGFCDDIKHDVAQRGGGGGRKAGRL